MHQYLRAVGFSDFKNKKELDVVLREVIRSYDSKMIVDEENNRIFAEMSKSFGCDTGITVCGEYDENDEFQMEYYFPYFRGTGISTGEDVIVEQHSEKESFSGACDDVRIGVTLIFYLTNAGEYLNQKYKGVLGQTHTTLTLAALSTEGCILLPIQKNRRQQEKDQQITKKRTQLINEARKGNEDAMESLTMEDMDTYSMISKRIENEDIFSIVDTHFMPYGMECDRYSILGEITEVLLEENTLTGEYMYQLSLKCNDMQFDVCINQKDLLGEPKTGRRFKGIIWLQGNVNF